MVALWKRYREWLVFEVSYNFLTRRATCGEGASFEFKNVLNAFLAFGSNFEKYLNILMVFGIVTIIEHVPMHHVVTTACRKAPQWRCLSEVTEHLQWFKSAHSWLLHMSLSMILYLYFCRSMGHIVYGNQGTTELS